MVSCPVDEGTRHLVALVLVILAVGELPLRELPLRELPLCQLGGGHPLKEAALTRELGKELWEVGRVTSRVYSHRSKVVAFASSEEWRQASGARRIISTLLRYPLCLTSAARVSLRGPLALPRTLAASCDGFCKGHCTEDEVAWRAGGAMSGKIDCG